MQPLREKEASESSQEVAAAQVPTPPTGHLLRLSGLRAPTSRGHSPWPCSFPPRPRAPEMSALCLRSASAEANATALPPKRIRNLATSLQVQTTILSN